MPVLFSSASPFQPRQAVDITPYSGHGILSASKAGRFHVQKGGINEDNFLTAIVGATVIPTATAALDCLRELRDTGAQAVAVVNEKLEDAGTTLAAAVTYGNWSADGNPDERGFAILCVGDSGLAWRDRESRSVVQLTVAQELCEIIAGSNGHPLTNWLGNNTGMQTAEQDENDQLMAFSQAQLAQILQDYGINSASGDLILFSDGIIQTASQSAATNDQKQYDNQTKSLQAKKLEELGKRQGYNNLAEALVNEAIRDGSQDDTTAIVMEFAPAPDPEQRIAYLCDGIGGYAGGWQASNAAVLAVSRRLAAIEPD